MKKALLILILCAVISVGIAVWLYPDILGKKTELIEEDDHDDHEDTVVTLSPEQIAEAHIEIEKAKPGTLDLALAVRGKITIHPDCLAHILPKVSGVAVEAKKNIGDEVHQGEVIAIFESREMADIKADYLASLEKEKLAWALLEREQKLFEKRISAEQDYWQAKSDYEAAKINTQLASQRLRAFGLSAMEIAYLQTTENPDLRIYEIRSPLQGTVINRHLTNGEYIESNETIYEIANLDNVWVEVGIYPKDLSTIKEGQKITIHLPLEKTEHTAVITYVSPIIHDETIMTKAVALVDNSSKKWRPGTLVNGTITTDTIDAPLVVAKAALQEVEGETVVFVKTPEGFEKRVVKVGTTDSNRCHILSGLQEGEEYAATNSFLLKADLGKHEAEHD